MGEFHKVCHIPGTDIPLPKSPLYSVFLSILPISLRTLFRIRYRGIHRIPKKGAVILAANHTSHIDPFTIICGVRRRTHYLSKDEHFDKFITAIVMNTTGQIRTHRESGAADALSSAIAPSVSVVCRSVAVVRTCVRVERNCWIFASISNLYLLFCGFLDVW